MLIESIIARHCQQLKDTELIKAIIANPFDPNGVPFLTVVFNFMGIWPAWCMDL